MKIPKKVIERLIKDDYNRKIINEYHFEKIILSELSIEHINKQQNQQILNRAYLLYCRCCLYKRINEKIDKLITINNFKDTGLFYRLLAYCDNHSNMEENLFYEESVKTITKQLIIYKGINFPTYDEFTSIPEYEEEYNLTINDHPIDLEELINYKFINKEKLICLLKENDFYLCCKQRKDYMDNKMNSDFVKKNNRIYEKEFKLINGAFDYLLFYALKNEDDLTIMELAKNSTELIYQKSKIKSVEDHIKKRKTKYRDDGKRNHLLHYKFKKELKNSNKYCIITGIELEPNSGLDCCHIKPYYYCTEEECSDGNNGIVLSHPFHVLFDNGYISFDNDGKILVSPFIPFEDKLALNKYNLKKSNLEIHRNKDKQNYLEWHRKNVFLDGKKFENDFEFNYNVRHWTERYELVKYHLDRFLVSDRMMMKMYDYILYAMDKTLSKPNEPCLDKKHYNVLCSLADGINVYCDSRNGKKNKDSVKYCCVDTEAIYKNDMRKKKYFELIDIISNQKESYNDYCNVLKRKERNEFKVQSKYNMLSNLYADMNDCNKAMIINEVRLKQTMFSRCDMIKNKNFEYNNKIIRNTLKNWNFLKSAANDYPFSYIHIIFLDVNNALNSISLTSLQELTLYKTLERLPLSKKEQSSYGEVIEKLNKKLNNL